MQPICTNASAVVRTICPRSCHPNLCGVLAEVREGKLVAVKGGDHDPTAAASSASATRRPRKSSTAPRACCTRWCATRVDLNHFTGGAAVLPDQPAEVSAFSAGRARFDAWVEVAAASRQA
jgi:hypothetical protein